MSGRISVNKTHKLYIGGQFPRSESGRTYPALDSDGKVIARMAQASRKDVRDAIKAARAAQPGWAGRTGYNRGQILYRIAEMVDERSAVFIEQLRSDRVVTRHAESRFRPRSTASSGTPAGVTSSPRCSGTSTRCRGRSSTSRHRSRAGCVHHRPGRASPARAGFAGGAGAGDRQHGGGGRIQRRPVPAVAFAEALAVSDVPGGVVNLLTGVARRADWLDGRSHGCERLDLSGVPAEAVAAAEIEAAENMKRVVRSAPHRRRAPS
jgi:hypothetical protein